MRATAMVEGPTNLTDEILAAAALKGDDDAFAELVSRYRDVALNYAFARLRSRDEAEDVAQEAFLRAYQAIGRFRLSECWAAWMMSILRNLCTDAQRRRRNGAIRLEDADYFSDSRPGPEVLALASEQRNRLMLALEALPEKYRVPLLMHYRGGNTYREIALALGLPESTIVGRMAGGIGKLRRRFGDGETL